jgi:addiction module RelB/DinJ family antitoxin
LPVLERGGTQAKRIPRDLRICAVDKGPIWGPFVSMPTIVLKSRVDRSNAAAARRVLSRLGLKPSDAVNALFAQIASRKALPFSLATSDSSYASEEYGLDRKGIVAVGKNLRKKVEKERLEGTVKSVSSIADLRE